MAGDSSPGLAPEIAIGYQIAKRNCATDKMFLQRIKNWMNKEEGGGGRKEGRRKGGGRVEEGLYEFCRFTSSVICM